jgi:hypothetical protein
MIDEISKKLGMLKKHFIFWMLFALLLVNSSKAGNTNKVNIQDIIASSDKIVLYKLNEIQIGQKKTEKFLGYDIVLGPIEADKIAREKTADLINKTLLFSSRDHETSCDFFPIIGISVQSKMKIINVLIDLHCNHISFYAGSTLSTFIVSSELSKTRADLIVQLKAMFSDDKEIQSLK